MPNSILREKEVKTVGVRLGLFGEVTGTVLEKITAPDFQELASAHAFLLLE